MALTEPTSKFNELIRRLDEAVLSDDGKVCCHKVKDALEEIVASGEDFLDERFLKPAPDKYARRLIHMDPQRRYSAMAMVWDTGQGTPIHDHDNMWCCECVYRGRIKVVSYDLVGGLEDDHVDFKAMQTIFAGPGEAGALIPPFDHHTIENVEEQPAVTIHVYGGEMNHCHVFLPSEGGGYERVERHLCYTQD